MSDPASPETWTDTAVPVAPHSPAGTLIPDEDAAIAPTLVMGASAEPWRPGPTLAPAAARVTVLPEIVRLGDRPTLRERSEARFLALGSAGEGGLGEVAVALDQDIGRKVAIKRIRQDPARRYPTAQAMLDRLAARAEGDVPIQCHVTFTQRVVSRGMRLLNQFPFAAAIAAVAGVATMGGAAWWVAVG